MAIWDDQKKLDKLEEQRNRLRESGKIMTFDCLNTVVKGDRVFCSKGQRLGQAIDGGLDLMTVLRGVCSGSCKNCESYNEEYAVD